jgi:hypothetical protein
MTVRRGTGRADGRRQASRGSGDSAQFSVAARVIDQARMPCVKPVEFRVHRSRRAALNEVAETVIAVRDNTHSGTSRCLMRLMFQM